MKNYKILGLQELTIIEAKKINGGLILEITGLCLAAFAMGWAIGKDAAERERRLS